MAGLGLITRRRAIQASPTQGDYIRFEDPEVFRVLMSNGVSSDGIGITPEDAAAVTDISNWFIDTTIETFDEFERFVNVTYLGFSNISSRRAFSGCASLKSITLPPNLTKLYDGTINYNGVGAFYGCTSLIHVGAIENLKEIGSFAFYNCTSLAFDELRLDNLTSLSQASFGYVLIDKVVLPKIQTFANGSSRGAFCNRTVPMTIDIGEDCTDLGSYLFSLSSRVGITMICRAATPPAIASPFYGGSAYFEAIYVPDASVDAYKTAPNWSTYAGSIMPLSEYTE